MPGAQKTYGKRSRAVYAAQLAFSPSSSPDPSPKTQALTIETIQSSAFTKSGVDTVATVRDQIISMNSGKDRTETATRELPQVLGKCSLAQNEPDTNQARRSPRRALGEIQVNSVVAPLEALSLVSEHTPSKRTNRRKDDGQGKGSQTHKIDARGQISGRGQHTFFDDEEESSQKHNEGEELEEVGTADPPQPRRSPRKAKQIRKLVPCIPQHVDASEDLPEDEVIVAAPKRREAPRDVQLGCPYQQHCSELLDLSTHPLTDFSTWSEDISEHFSVTKIAEASFGEVYRLSLLEDISDFCSTDESVFKVIPLTPALDALPLDKRKRNAALKRAEGMTSPHDVATEVKLLQRMSSIPGFTNFRDVRILQGRPPSAFVSAFKSWNATQISRKKELSHFPDPAKKTSYNADQLWAVIEMQDAGTDLERLLETTNCTSIFPIWDVFWHTVLTIAKGEESAEFEHRDLHLGNICVRHPSANEANENTIDPSRKLNFTSLETTIIDYTLSRCLMTTTSSSPSSPSPNDKPVPGNEIAYTDLSLPHHKSFFEGDSSDEYQYDIYRYMRGALYFDHPFHPTISAEDLHSLTPSELSNLTNGRNWKQFHPQTNLCWLHLILYKLLEQIEWPSSSAKGRAAKKNRKKRPEEFEIWKRGVELEGVLLAVQDLLDPNRICGEDGVRSTRDLVAVAVAEGWLDVEDLGGEGEDEDLVEEMGELEIC
ncbi:hypothetical protein CBER1_05897 [Cercospora berteroae]|uniref:non-specific serine/threonine protein kinase n=1 Tax=Cercospora berteroae TaxID=357750 RepID=A0A2S6BSC1_9PEZI|nr:hypothetical protein CBER1_05897 [Cercospora berteroae]